MKRTLLLIVISCLVMTGCGWWQKSSDEKPAEVLANEGMDSFREGKYMDAILSFEKLKDWYPFSKYAILAELKIADAQYNLEQYEDAVFSYEDFESLHPRNEAIPYVIYQIGRCYFNRIDTIDRDHEPAQKALETFKRLLSEYPNTEYTDRARMHLNACLKHLAENDFYVGMFYYKSKHYKAALKRFQSIIENYPDVGVHHDALQYMELSKQRLEEEAASSESE